MAVPSSFEHQLNISKIVHLGMKSFWRISSGDFKVTTSVLKVKHEQRYG